MISYKNNFSDFSINKNINLWLIPFNLESLNNTYQEIIYSKSLNSKKAERYLYTRSYMRLALSHLLDIKPDDVPLDSPPGKIPKLNKGLGYLSLSHCKDMILLGWSNSSIGVDIERKDRKYKMEIIYKFFLKNFDKKIINLVNGKISKSNILDLWVVKEAIIKTQNGNIFYQFKDWECNQSLTSSFNKEKKLKLATFQFVYKDWTIGIANQSLLQSNLFSICLF